MVFKKGVCDFTAEPWTKRVVFREEIEDHCGLAVSITEPVSVQKVRRFLRLTAKYALKMGADFMEKAMVGYAAAGWSNHYRAIAIGGDKPVVSDESVSVRIGLCNQKPVKRIGVDREKVLHFDAVCGGNRKFEKSGCKEKISCRCGVEGKECGVLRPFDCDFPYRSRAEEILRTVLREDASRLRGKLCGVKYRPEK